MKQVTDYIDYKEAGSIPGLFELRIKKNPGKMAYRQYDEPRGVWVEKTWADMNRDASCWQGALENEGLMPGDRVGLMVRNSIEWVLCDMASLASGLVVVPIFIKDSHENIVHIINDAGIKLLVVEDSDTWQQLAPVHGRIPSVGRVLIIRRFKEGATSDPRVKYYEDWLCTDDSGIYVHDVTLESPATIVYTSGTTGLPKGAVLTHHNMLWNAHTGLRAVTITPDDLFLSFLPLTHMFERTVGYYLAIMAGGSVVYARNVRTVAEDMLTQHPTVIVSVPLVFQRIYERVVDEVGKASPVKRWIFKTAVDIGYGAFLHKQGRGPWSPLHLLNPLLYAIVGKKILGKMGGRLRLAVAGGAALPEYIWRLFVAIGLPVIQGYGMTETSPVLSVNREDNNRGDTVGPPMDEMEIRITESGEIIAKTPGMMKGYWNNEEATRKIIDADGWVHTGDIGEMSNGHLKITGRLKQIIVMSNGEKVPPDRVEAEIKSMGIFENLMVYGEQKPFLLLMGKPLPDKLKQFADENGFAYEGEHPPHGGKFEEALIAAVNAHLGGFPGYVRVKRLLLVDESWLPENGLLTNTLKLKRHVIEEKYRKEIDAAYAG